MCYVLFGGWTYYPCGGFRGFIEKSDSVEELEKVVKEKNAEYDWWRDEQISVMKTERYVNPIMQYFEFDHLPSHLQNVSRELCELAKHMENILPSSPEVSTGLRKLLEAKDCFVRAALSENK